ncbi:MAG: branched-chain amino acid transport system substrate-binding protein [Acidimicrobiaceae bacterium]|jgi:ABC-type branched-subunit amino acid transport system substrate-binding protein
MTRTRGRHLRIAAVLIGLTLLAAACGSDSKKAAGTASSSGAPAAPKGTPGALAGMKGTTPLVDLDASAPGFKALLDGQGLDLKAVYNYGAESYDSVTVMALAIQIAKSDGIDFAKEINGVTRGGTKCTTFKDCSALIKAGTTDIDYDGKSGPLEFSGNGEPTIASYGIQQFVATDKIDDALTTYKIAKAPTAADVANVPVEGTRAGDGVFKIGTLLPETGNLSFLGPPERAGVRLAVKEINDQGGVLGKPIEVSEGDSGDTSTDIASKTVDRELGEGVDTIIGAASSGVTLTVIDKVINAGVTMFSPAATSKKLSTYPDKGLFFRDAPSDILQGQVLADFTAAEGVNNLAIINRNDAYGTGLTEDLTKSFTGSGGKVIATITYDQNAQTFDAEVSKLKDAGADGIIVIGFAESARILALMVQKGIGPSSVKVYGCDGNMGNTLGKDFEAGTISK